MGRGLSKLQLWILENSKEDTLWTHDIKVRFFNLKPNHFYKGSGISGWYPEDKAAKVSISRAFQRLNRRWLVVFSFRNHGVGVRNVNGLEPKDKRRHLRFIKQWNAGKITFPKAKRLKLGEK